MSGKNRFKYGLKSLMRFTPLGRALVWEALIRWKKKEIERGEDGFKIADITDKWETHHSSVKNQIECLTREGWLTIRKLEGERPVWILPKKKQEILGDWISMHLDNNLAKAVHIPQFPLVANWLFEELREGAKPVHLLRNKLKGLKFGEKYAQSNSYKTAKEWGVETTLNRIIEMIEIFLLDFCNPPLLFCGQSKSGFSSWANIIASRKVNTEKSSLFCFYSLP